MRPDSLRRRRFLQMAASAASAAAVSCGGGNSPWRFLTAAEGETAGAICDRIIPADQDPGASAAGVVNYIDLQLTGPYKKYQRAYRQGLAGIDRASASRHGKPFAALPPEEQDRLLTEMDAGKLAAGALSQALAKRFFDMIRDHTMQGYYGDPRHGGNREYASWRMLGVPPVPVRGRNLYDLSGEGLARRRQGGTGGRNSNALSPERTKWRSNA